MTEKEITAVVIYDGTRRITLKDVANVKTEGNCIEVTRIIGDYELTTKYYAEFYEVTYTAKVNKHG